MTKSAQRPSSRQGEQRRKQLIEAGVELLAEGGWPAVTTRAVADRAGVNLGLIHYYLGGLGQLEEGIAKYVGDLLFAPVSEGLLLSVGSAEEARERLCDLASATDERTAKLTVQLVAGALREPALATVLRDGLAAAREELALWIHEQFPSGPEGTETALLAMLDGLILHRLIDPHLDAEAATRAFAALLPAPGDQKPE